MQMEGQCQTSSLSSFLQKTIMSVIFEIFHLQTPDWTNDFIVALASVGEWQETRHPSVSHSVLFKFLAIAKVCGLSISLLLHDRPPLPPQINWRAGLQNWLATAFYYNDTESSVSRPVSHAGLVEAVRRLCGWGGESFAPSQSHWQVRFISVLM